MTLWIQGPLPVLRHLCGAGRKYITGCNILSNHYRKSGKKTVIVFNMVIFLGVGYGIMAAEIFMGTVSRAGGHYTDLFNKIIPSRRPGTWSNKSFRRRYGIMAAEIFMVTVSSAGGHYTDLFNKIIPSRRLPLWYNGRRDLYDDRKQGGRPSLLKCADMRSAMGHRLLIFILIDFTKTEGNLHMGTMMEVLDKIMSNITGVTLGALIMFVGLFIQPSSSIDWLPNVMIFGGMFIVVMFLTIALRQYVDTVNPDFGRVTAIADIEEQNKNAANAGKAKAFDLQITLYGVMFVAFSLLGASWKVLTVLMVCCIISQGVALLDNYRVFQARRQQYLSDRR